MLILKLFEIYMIFIVYMNTQHIHVEQFHGIGGLADGSNFANMLVCQWQFSMTSDKK